MTRNAVRRRLALEWWGFVAAALLPLLPLKMIGSAIDSSWPALDMPLFIAGLASMFVSLRLFRNYKHLLIATQAALDTQDEPQAWALLAHGRRSGLLGAALPAWIAALAALVGLNSLALSLLVVASVVIGCLYRIPPQLG